jgi:hypothetical protein
MRRRVYQFLIVGIVALCAGALTSGPLQAQAEPPPEAAARDGRAQGDAAPSPQGPGQQLPEGDARASPAQPDVQQGCPDQGRPLQLIV